MLAATAMQPFDGTLTPELRHELGLAKARSRPIHKAARVAAFNAWVTAVIAALSVPFAFFSIPAFLMTIGLALVAYNEFRGRRRLLDRDPSSAAILGWNQIGLLTLITVYCVWMLVTSIGSFTSELDANPELKAALGSIEGFDDMYQQLVVVFYGTVVLLSAVFQGLNALYYFTRRKYVKAYQQETPAWVQEIERVSSHA